MADQREVIRAQMLVLKEQLALAQAAAAVSAPSAVVEPVPLPVSKVALVVGNIGAAVLSIGLQGSDTALCDDGATIDCFLTTDGVIPGTHDSSQGGPLTVGDKKVVTGVQRGVSLCDRALWRQWSMAG